jgi:hypothetical protein
MQSLRRLLSISEASVLTSGRSLWRILPQLRYSERHARPISRPYRCDTIASSSNGASPSEILPPAPSTAGAPSIPTTAIGQVHSSRKFNLKIANNEFIIRFIIHSTFYSITNAGNGCSGKFCQNKNRPS